MLKLSYALLFCSIPPSIMGLTKVNLLSQEEIDFFDNENTGSFAEAVDLCFTLDFTLHISRERERDRVEPV